MGKNKFIKKPANKNSDAKTVKTPPTVEIENFDYPVFCFKNIHKGHGIEKCTNDQKAALIEKIGKLSQMTWNEIRLAPRHGMGTEKIHVKSLKVNPPSFITQDVEFLLALRFSGKNPFLVHQNRFIMHVIFIDSDFSVYNHG